MPEALRIEDKDARGFLAFDLNDLLAVIGDEGRRLIWAVQGLSVSGRLDDGKSVVDLEAESEQLPHGLVMTWAELTSFSLRLTQVQDGVFAGCRDRDCVPVIGNDESLYGQSEIVLEAIDSSYWHVYARDESLLKRFRERFAGVTVVSAP